MNTVLISPLYICLLVCYDKWPLMFSLHRGAINFRLRMSYVYISLPELKFSYLFFCIKWSLISSLHRSSITTYIRNKCKLIYFLNMPAITNTYRVFFLHRWKDTKNARGSDNDLAGRWWAQSIHNIKKICKDV